MSDIQDGVLSRGFKRARHRFAAKHRDVGQVNTADNARFPTSEQPASGEAPPVLARVPWLNSIPTEAAPRMPHAEPPPAHDPSYMEAHSVFAASGLGVTTIDVDPVCLRVDPPQPKTTVDVADKTMHPAPPRTSAAASLAPFSTPLSASKPTAATPVSAERPTTFLRFDPPAQSAVEHVATSHVSHTTPTSTWHQWVAAIDDGIRQYQKVIMLAALLTAAGLMMLVVESQQPSAEPAAEDVSPIASDEVTEPSPAPLADTDLPPTTEADAQQDSVKAATTARGPQSDTRTRSVAVQDSETMLVPFTPDAESTAGQDTLVLPEVSEDWATSASDQCEPAAVVGYPDTRAPPFEIPLIDIRSTQESRPPSVAHLSGDLQSVSPQTTK